VATNSTTITLGVDYNTAQVLLNYMELMLLTALALAVFFTLGDRESRTSIRRFIGDMFIRWGIAGLGLWTIVLIFWGLYELGLQRGLFHFIPWVGIAEYGIWGVAMSGIMSLLFFAASLFVNALMRTPNTVKVIYTPYYTYLEEYATYLAQWYNYYRSGQYRYQYEEEQFAEAPVKSRE